MGYILGNLNPYQKPTDCFYRGAPSPRYSFHTNVGQTMDCADYGIPAAAGIGTCLVSGPPPPDCVAGTLAVAAHSWVDGTDCDAPGCKLGLILGGIANGQQFQTGQFCPYDPSQTPPITPQPPPDDPKPPECNADGSCTYCVGDKCATTGATNDQGPPPPSAGSTGSPDGNHDTGSHTDYNGGGYPGGSSSSGGGGPGTGTSTGGGGSGYPLPPTSADTKCTTGVCDVGEADGNIGGLYSHSDQTPGSVFGGYMSSIQNAPVVAAAGSFFSVSAGGSCPSWHIPGNQYWGAAGFDFSFFCSSAMLALFQLAGYLVLAAGAFCAFRIALY